MILRTIATGSSGNCHALISNDNEILLLDVGVGIKEIKRGIDYRISDVAGAVVSHGHGDHARSVKNFEGMGIPVYAPYKEMYLHIRGKFSDRVIYENDSNFTVTAVSMTDLNGKFTHTNSDGTECPCYGFLIQHPEMGRLLYITDTEFVKWRFKNINHILISCNYQSEYITDDEAKRNHVLRGHMELETVKEFIKANKSSVLRNVILCHLSQENIDPIEAQAEVEKVANCSVYVAHKGLEIELSEFPF